MPPIKDNSLPKQVINILREKATEPPHSGLYNDFNPTGSYLCRSCGEALFRSQTKFTASCGWPSFDKSIENKVTKKPDADGFRTEILCTNCHAHLGHVFDGEGYTQTNQRYCVNSSSLDFVENSLIIKTEEAILAAGCFWGVQYYLQRLPGVLKTEVGYTGGHTSSPSYHEVCSGTTGHYEAIRILYNPEELSYKNLLKYFFEIHDFSQKDGQGPDRGQQYESVIFYYDEVQKNIARQVIHLLEINKCPVATHLLPVSEFWPAESDHQEYYEKNKHTPYCHKYTKRF
ncbi:MAG: bifunctional methionine sulfoxide reductase B/A protein [Legionella sp.]|nr:bifunctional methionine sulfoxide reductase B/A protein [Legionella sp.]